MLLILNRIKHGINRLYESEVNYYFLKKGKKLRHYSWLCKLEYAFTKRVNLKRIVINHY